MKSVLSRLFRRCRYGRSRVKFVFYSVALVACVALLLSLALLHIATDHLGASYHARVGLLSRQLTDQAYRSFAENRDPAVLNTMITSAVQREDIAMVACFDRIGETRAVALAADVPQSMLEHLYEYGRISKGEELHAYLQQAQLELRQAPLTTLGSSTGSPRRPSASQGTLLIAHRPGLIQTRATLLQRSIWRQTAVAIAVVIGLALVATRSFTKPILELLRNTQRVARGDQLACIVVSSGDEIGELGTAFNSMTEEVQCNRSELEAHRTKLSATVDARISALKEALLELKKVDQEKDRILSSVSHEFRTPLTSVLFVSEVLLDSGVDPETEQEFLQTLDTAIEHLDRLSLSFLRLTQVEDENFQLATSACDPRHWLQRIVEGVRTRTPDRQILFRSGECKQATVVWDEAMIGAAVEELIRNGIEFSEAGSAVQVSLHDYRSGVQIRVRDHGCGIPMTERERVFKRFYQISSTWTDKPPGLGLGLTYCRRVASLHGGQISFANDDEPGLDVVLDLPRVAVINEPHSIGEEIRQA